MGACSHWTWVAAAALISVGRLETPGASQEDRSLRARLDTSFARALEAALEETDPGVIWQVGTPLEAVPGAWTAVNRRAGLRAFFTESGVHVVPRGEAGPVWSLALAGFGRGDASARPLRSAPSIQGPYVEYERGALREWFLNEERGLEHGFTLLERPPEGAQRAPVAIELVLGGDFEAEPAPDGRSARFSAACGEVALTYGSLAAWDAEGRQLEARIELDGARMRLLVDDHGASYPITVDPLIAVQIAELVGTGVGVNRRLGWDVALDGDRAAVLAFPRLVYVFERVNGVWSQDAVFAFEPPSKLHSNPASIALAGDVLIVGDLSDEGKWTGEAHAWIKLGGTWQFSQTFVPHFGWWSYETMGTDVAMHGNVALITNPDHTHWGGWYRGCVYVYSHNLPSSGWQESFHLLAQTGYMGRSVDMDGDTVVATADANVAVFRDPTSSGTVEALLVPPGYGPYTAESSCALRGDTLFVGQPLDDDLGTDAGAVSAYVRTGTTWTLQQKLYAGNAAAGDKFGASLAFIGEAIAVGTPKREKVFLFARNNGWRQAAVLGPSPLGNGGGFGTSLSASGSTLVVGAPARTVNGVASAGSVFVFEVQDGGPLVYCTAKANSQGCLPQIGFTGTPSVSSPAPFTVRTTKVLNNRNGLFYYGLSGRASLPFQGGTQCVAPPVRRTNVQSSGGNPPPDDCSGVFTLDFNAWIQSGVDPNLVAGAQVHLQCWSRDPSSASGSSLSDAVELTIGA